MAEEPEERFCPTCHSRLGKIETEIIDLSRSQGSEGKDDNDDPIPRWSNDPVRTSGGFNGPEFVAPQYGLVTDIIELQKDRAEKEVEVGLEDLTLFSDPTIGHIRESIINELRESTEKLLDGAGVTLQEYFSSDADGEPTTDVGPSDVIKDEWTDVKRGRKWIHTDGSLKGTFTLPDTGEVNSPSLPANTRLKAIHLEDLRRFVSIGLPSLVITNLKEIEPQFATDEEIEKKEVKQVLFAFKTSGATFKKAEVCE